MSSHIRNLITDLLYNTDCVAFTLEQPLRPLLGRTVYPASYAASESGKDKGPRYCITELRNGDNVCVIDSVPSQANRIEQIWASDPAYTPFFPLVTVEAQLADGSSDTRQLMELGHRAADGAVLASDLVDTATSAMQSLARAGGSPAALARFSPTSLLMGLWDSRPNRTGLKLPRAFSSTIEAENVTVRTRHAQYNSAWHAADLGAELQAAMKGVKPSALGLDGAPAGDGLGGIEVFGAIHRRAWLAATPLRNNLAIGSSEPDDPEHGLAAQYIAALGLLALTMPAAPWLRSGCNLVPDGPAKLQRVARDGSSREVELTHDEVLAALGSLAHDMAWQPLAGKITKASMAKHVAASKKGEKDS